jgi:MFS family permease
VTTSTLPVIGAAALDHRPRFIHAFILLVTSSLTVLVTAILGPSLPAMQAHFAGTPGVEFMVPLTMTAPMLMMAALSVVAGSLADRVGRKRLLVWATALYAVFGTAPLWLDSLTAILASRIALGVMEAVLMTISTTLIGDYYTGAQREKLVSLQTTVAAFSALVFNALGGVIAEQGWRAPYTVYAISLVLAPLMAFFLWEPSTKGVSLQARSLADGGVVFQPRRLLGLCLLAIPTGIVFLTVSVHFGYLFGAIGIKSPALIGTAYAFNAAGKIAGTLLFGWVLAPRLAVGWQLATSMLVTAGGFIWLKFAGDYNGLVAAGALSGLGVGLLLPTMVTWAMRGLPFSRRGFGMGAFNSCMFLGHFVNPIIVVALAKSLGDSRAAAIGDMGFVLVVLAAVVAVVQLRSRRS